MHYTGQIYRHPTEWLTPLLEVTIGCSHNKCAFCTMYQETPFRPSPMEHILEDIEELSYCDKNMERIHLLNGDPFVLSFDKLKKIGEAILKYLPKIKTITCYASIANIKSKTLDELIELRRLGFDELHVGLETGYAPAITMLNKDFCEEEAYIELEKLNKANIRYDALLMLGVAGKGKSKENVEATAKLLNATKPFMVSVMPTAVFPNSPLEQICQKGDYVEQTEREMLEEEIMLLNALNFDAEFMANHPANLVPVKGFLKDKETIIEAIEHGMAKIDPNKLYNVRPRGVGLPS